MPAMPLTGNAYEDFAGYDGTKNTSYNPDCQGLTKLEHFAGLAMQGWLARCANAPHSAFINPKDVADTAVDFAKALLERLEGEANE